MFPNNSFLQADDYSSASFIVRDPVITIEGGKSSSASFEYISSSGQVVTGENTSTTFISRAGFLYFPDPSSSSTPTPGSGGGSGGTSGYFPTIDPELKKKAMAACDFNKDGLCNIADFSILLYYYNLSGPEIEPYDMNSDGQINLIDVSILFFYWNA